MGGTYDPPTKERGNLCPFKAGRRSAEVVGFSSRDSFLFGGLYFLEAQLS